MISAAGTNLTDPARSEDRVPPRRERFAWGDSKAEPLGAGCCAFAAPLAEEKNADEDARRRGYRQAASFYDREALKEQLEALQKEDRDLAEKDAGLRLRLAKARTTLSAMRTKKRCLSEKKMLGEAAASVLPAKGTRGVYRESTGNGASGRHEHRDKQREEEANVSSAFGVVALLSPGGTPSYCAHVKKLRP